MVYIALIGDYLWNEIDRPLERFRPIRANHFNPNKSISLRPNDRRSLPVREIVSSMGFVRATNQENDNDADEVRLGLTFTKRRSLLRSPMQHEMAKYAFTERSRTRQKRSGAFSIACPRRVRLICTFAMRPVDADMEFTGSFGSWEHAATSSLRR